MKRFLLPVMGVCLLGLAGCDKVKIPVINPIDQEASTAAPDPVERTVVETPAPDVAEPSAPTDVASTETDTNVLDTARDAAEDGTDEESDSDAPEGSEGSDEPAVRVATSLAALNAKRCGLAEGDTTTPTIGMVAGATTVEEQMVGTAAVNALASQLTSFPGIVKLEPREVSDSGAVTSGHCGATRIAEHWFISAAHCVDEDYQELQLITGSENIRSPLARTVLADIAICHGGYDGVNNGYDNDIALIHVNEAMASAMGEVPIAKFGRTSKALAPINYPDVDMAGWGITSYGGQLSNQLLGAKLKLNGAGPALINVASQAGAGPCIGDSGGPLYATEADGSRTVVGVLSVVEQNRVTGEFCAGQYNGRYTNLQGFSDWIASVINLCETDEEMCQ